MTKATKTNIDKLLKPAIEAFKRTAEEAIREAEDEVRNILQVRYDAGPECFPEGLPVPRLQLRWENRVPGLGFPCHYELVFPLRDFDIRNEKTGSGFGLIELGRCHRQGPGDDFFSTPWVNHLMPHRDGAHAQWDSSVFGNLPIYLLTPTGRIELIEPDARVQAA